MQAEIRAVAMDLQTADGTAIPVLVTSTVKTVAGQPVLVRTIIADARDRRAYEREILAAREAAEQDREHLQQIVGALRRSFLPPALPEVPGMKTAAYYHTASADEFGGDFYDLFALRDGRWCFFLGDVCGKGVDAAAVTSLARYTLRATAIYHPDPVAVLTNLNTVLFQAHDGDPSRYCTAVIGVLTPDGNDMSVTAASGGHPMPLIIRADGVVDELSRPGGPLIGIGPDMVFTATDLTLHRGDTMLVYTDGLTDARHGDGRYGRSALRTFAADLAPVDAPNLITALTGLLSTFGEGLDDDTALLAMSIDTSGPSLH
jgi:sigma-B regulation protein RsbU (phosphoserine phosphatase)